MPGPAGGSGGGGFGGGSRGAADIAAADSAAVTTITIIIDLTGDFSSSRGTDLITDTAADALADF